MKRKHFCLETNQRWETVLFWTVSQGKSDLHGLPVSQVLDLVSQGSEGLNQLLDQLGRVHGSHQTGPGRCTLVLQAGT